MGTNFYLIEERKPPCSQCGHEYVDRKRHIGKSSMGWCFSLHVIPEDGIHDLDDWQREWSKPGVFIENEYGERIEPAEMLSWITDRRGKSNFKRPYPKARQELEKRVFGRAPRNWEGFHADNHSEPGPKGLLRHQIGRYCIKHGEGTWDCMVGEFS